MGKICEILWFSGSVICKLLPFWMDIVLETLQNSRPKSWRLIFLNINIYWHWAKKKIQTANVSEIHKTKKRNLSNIPRSYRTQCEDYSSTFSVCISVKNQREKVLERWRQHGRRFLRVNHAVPSRRWHVSSKSSGIPRNHLLGEVGGIPFWLVPAWLVDFCCHRGLRGWTWECEFVGKGAYEARQKALRLAHYQQLWPNGTLRRATQCCTGPHRPRAPVQPSPALPPPALRQRNLIARSIIIFVTPRSPLCSATPLFLFRRDFSLQFFPSRLIRRNRFHVNTFVFD